MRGFGCKRASTKTDLLRLASGQVATADLYSGLVEVVAISGKEAGTGGGPLADVASVGPQKSPP